MKSGRLYVVATPIGNLADWSPRAREVLESVDLIAAEDTRHSGVLLKHFGIDRPLLALHEHNERDVVPELVARMAAGARVAQISDAGTPLVSDPGFHLVRAAQEAGITVVPVPGPSAVLAALAAAGLPTDRFVFEGFLPPKEGARRQRLEAMKDEPRTQVYFEAPHRVEETLGDLVRVFGADREAVVARELTKTFETIRRGTLAELAAWVAEDANQRRGEIVLVVAGAPARP
ncbi:MAG TPA: 16S rRNA (cytidine(1402)-2'-O)-methyltransferase, partial [Geothrix sp.]|nr:16S rRNA (cytidine(1402)-2'-O)-methyltransferase [Geothrix sp.]